MRKPLKIFGLIILVLTLVFAALVGYLDYKHVAIVTKIKMHSFMLSHDPKKALLEEGYNSYVKRTLTPDGIEYGMIRLSDGAKVKYWFRSHHLSSDHGGTWFEYENGHKRFVSGYFCCEVQLPEKQPQSTIELNKFLDRIDGVHP